MRIKIISKSLIGGLLPTKLLCN